MDTDPRRASRDAGVPPRHRPAAPGRHRRPGARRISTRSWRGCGSSIPTTNATHRGTLDRASGSALAADAAIRCCSCCRGRSRWCCSSPAPTSATCFSPPRSAASTSSPSAPRSARRGRAACARSFLETAIIAGGGRGRRPARRDAGAARADACSRRRICSRCRRRTLCNPRVLLFTLARDVVTRRCCSG